MLKHIQRVPLRSPDVRSVGYDCDTQTLEVELRDLRVFRYYGVPSALHGGFMASDLPGEFFLRYIKESYESERIF